MQLGDHTPNYTTLTDVTKLLSPQQAANGDFRHVQSF